MSTPMEPNPPSRQSGGFPKTNTIPDGWVLDQIMDSYNHSYHAEPVDATVPTTGGRASRVNGKAAPAPTESSENESPFARRLEPFPSPWDLNGTGL